MIAPRACVSCTVNSRMLPHTLCHWASITRSMPSAIGVTVPKATISGARIFPPPSQSTAVRAARPRPPPGRGASPAAARSDRRRSYEDRLGQERGHDPVGRIHDLADLEVDRHRADDVSLLAAEPAL